MNLEFAIVDANMFTCIGLQKLLTEIIPQGQISVFRSFEELVMNSPERFVHCFVSSGIYFEHAQYFLAQRRRCIVLVQGDAFPRIPGLLTLNVCQDEVSLVKSFLHLKSRGDSHHPGVADAPSRPAAAPSAALPLSPREIEVAILLAKGCQNKEVADRLNISPATAMSHRKSIMQKLHAHSLADIVLHVVMNGLVAVDEL